MFEDDFPPIKLGSQGFLTSLLQYEARLFSLSGCTESMMEMQGILGIGIGSNENLIVSQPPNLPNLSKHGWTKLCGRLCAYCLADVVAFLGGCKPNEAQVLPSVKSPRKELYVRTIYSQFESVLKLRLLQGMSKLQQWPTLVTNFHMLMQKVAVPAQNPFSDASSSSTFRLLHLISKNEWSKSFSNVEGNFLIAAMHISCMREFRFSPDSYPDIPERLGSMVPT